MIKASTPLNEEERLIALSEYHILDTGYERIFDKIVEIASNICGVPISVISLVDRNRQWVKSKRGITIARETPRDTSFCSHVILDSEIMEVNDATKDLRFSDNPYVLESPHIQFYAGAPLINPDGFKIGALCVMDRKPGMLSADQRKVLKNLAVIIINLFETKKNILNDVNKRRTATQALAVTNSLLKNTIAEQNQMRNCLILLNDMSHSLQSALNKIEVNNIIKRYGYKLFPQSSGYLYLIDPSLSHVGLECFWGEKESNKKFINSVESLLIQGKNIKPILNSDYLSQLIKKNLKGKIYFCVPLHTPEQNIGVFYFNFSNLRIKLRSDECQSLATIMAEHVSLTLLNLNFREALEKQSIQDPLTGLYNRRYLSQMISYYSQNLAAFKIGCILLDLDHFKKFNDEYGHDVGDMVLIKTTERISALSKHLGKIYRMGGEEFLIILEHTTLVKLQNLAELIRCEVQAIRIRYKGYNLPVITLSLGVAMFDKHAETLNQLIIAADTALYKAKITGRNKVVMAKRSEVTVED